MIANSARSNISDALPRSLSTLPPELLCDIFSYVVARHETGGYVVDAQCLASLAVVCRSLRAVAQDMLFREVYITNEHQLRAVAQCPPRLLQNLSELNIFLDSKFYELWQKWAFLSALDRLNFQSSFQPLAPISPYAALALILSRTPSLRDLRIRIAQSSSVHSSSAWRHQFAFPHARAMPFGAGFNFALSHPSSIVAPGAIQLPQLRRLELDGFEDVQSLLELAPGLKVLRMQLTGGYSPGAMTDLCVALREARGLSELTVTPETLRLVRADAPVDHVKTDQGTLLDVIGKALPSLHKLDLRGYWHGDEINYLSSREYLQPEALLSALKHFPTLQTLDLPLSIMSEGEHIILRNAPHLSSQEDLAHFLSARRRAIISLEDAEVALLSSLVDVAPSLLRTSFVRPVAAEDLSDSCVSYALAPYRAPSSRSSGSSSPPPATSRPVLSKTIIPASASPAAVSAWPFSPPPQAPTSSSTLMSLPLTITHTAIRLWTTASNLEHFRVLSRAYETVQLMKPRSSAGFGETAWGSLGSIRELVLSNGGLGGVDVLASGSVALLGISVGMGQTMLVQGAAKSATVLAYLRSPWEEIGDWDIKF